MALRERLVYAIDVVTDGVDTGLNRINKEMREAEGWSNKLKAGWKGAVDEFKNSRGAQAAAVGSFAAVAKYSIDQASALEESVNAVRVTFGETADEVLKLGENSAESFGLAKSEFNALAVQFSSFAKQVSAGTGESVGAVIEDLSTRVADFASVMNLDLATATQVFMSTLSGETEPIRRFGKDVSAAAVEQYALANGLIKSKSELTESIKVQARYGLLMEQTADTAGDFKNTSDGLANSQRVLMAQVKDTAAAFGEELVPAVANLTNGLSDLLAVADKIGDSPVGNNPFAKALKRAVEDTVNPIGGLSRSLGEAKNELKDLFGVEEDVTQATEGATRAIDDATTAFGSLVSAARLAISSTEDSASAQDLVATAIADANTEYDRQEQAIRDATDAARDHADAVYDLYDAEGDLAEAVADATETLQAVKDGEFDGTMYDVRDSIVAVARAADEQARAQVEANGVNADSIVGQQMWAEAMLNTANTLSGPMREEVLNHISRVTGIPTSVITTFGVNIDPGALRALEDLLARLGRIANNPFARVSGSGTMGGARIDGPRTEAAADGSYNAGGATLINDGLGGELVQLPNGSKVMTAANTRNHLRGSEVGAVQQLVVQVNAGAVVASRAELGRVFASALREAQRQGVSLAFLRDVG